MSAEIGKKGQAPGTKLGDEKKRYFPADKKLIDWLWEHPDIREELWKTMEENQE